MSRDFDGSGDYLSVTNDSLIQLSSGFTVSLWMYPDAVASYRTLFCKSSGGTREYGLFLESASKAYVSTGGNETSATVSSNWTTTSWQHVVLRKNGSAVTVWRNGTQVASMTHAGSSTNTNPLRIGKDDVGGGSDYDGRMADFAIWQVSLSDAEIASLAKGFAPPGVRLAGLTFFCPIYGNDNPERDMIGGRAATPTNTTKSETFPPVYRMG